MKYVPRLTMSARLVMAYMALKNAPVYGYEVQQAMGLHNETVFAMFARYERDGLIEQVPTPAGAQQLKGGNPRIYYALTERGQAFVEELRSDRFFAMTTATLEGSARRGDDGRVVELGL